MSANEDIDLDLLNRVRPGIAGSVDRWLGWLDEMRSRPEVISFTVVLLLGLVALGYLTTRPKSEVDVADLIPEIRLETTLPSATPEPDLLVHVSGAVVRPGVYTLGEGARVLDAIEAAGGPTSEGLVHQLNLAAPLEDGVQVRVPIEGETVQPIGPDPNTSSQINVNRASAQELERLTGIGPAIASAIVSYRDDHGSFSSAEELLEVPGIGPAKLEMFIDQVVVN